MILLDSQKAIILLLLEAWRECRYNFEKTQKNASVYFMLCTQTITIVLSIYLTVILRTEHKIIIFDVNLAKRKFLGFHHFILRFLGFILCLNSEQ